MLGLRSLRLVCVSSYLWYVVVSSGTLQASSFTHAGGRQEQKLEGMRHGSTNAIFSLKRYLPTHKSREKLKGS
jgi:hypothetical protein